MCFEQSARRDSAGERHLCEVIRRRRKAQTDLTGNFMSGQPFQACLAGFSQVVHKPFQNRICGKSLKIRAFPRSRSLREICYSSACEEAGNKLAAFVN